MTVYLPGSFRGVPFEVESYAGTFGRRTADHEFPQRDIPYTEDMGRATREIRLTAYVSGAAYAANRDALIRALELEGPGTLVHPWLGVMLVNARPGTISEDKEAMESATIEMSFLEAGALIFPLSVVDVGSVVDAAGEAVAEAAAFDFADVFDVVLKPGNVALAAIENVRAAIRGTTAAVFGPATRLLDQFDAIAASMKGIESDVNSLVRAPSDLAARFTSLFDLLDRPSTDRTLADLATVGTPGEAVPVTATTPTTQQIAQNAIVLRTLTRRLAIARSARLAARETFPVYDDAVRVRDEQAARILAEEEFAASTRQPGDDVYVALTEMRTALVRGITDAAADLVRLRTLELPAVDCSLLIAHDLYGDTERADEIVDRNAIAHPGFVSPGQLLVLSA